MTRDTAELGFSPPDRILITFGPAALGLLLTVSVPVAARWVLRLPAPLPFRPVLVALGRVDAWGELAVLGALLVAAGMFAAAALHEHLAHITVTREQVRLGGRVLPRADIAAVHPDGESLVVLDRQSRQAARCVPRARWGVLARTFREFGYPWSDTDPYADLYRPWTGVDELPPEIAAVFAARAVALRKRATEEAGELRATLEKLGYSVRDEGDRQHWRRLVQQ
ncbi:YqeB family protein [Actinoplanes teichomyceticus]|uniref:Uncharacterized protein n=1 Tax=Actinoplanes teichomyceticus TaxID=1867 RepID=A0A561WA22_ACTTI|nr:hypothetical protein [Actinoplanes teichomyceticus]TWG20701.1 hypothetical protein FHX34_103230 [Actinoplanes teichomyceticus]GIF14357.1 hypothetical protein Ate01nite_43890 [Actinoplanes teichomyceticus]